MLRGAPELRASVPCCPGHQERCNQCPAAAAAGAWGSQTGLMVIVLPASTGLQMGFCCCGERCWACHSTAEFIHPTAGSSPGAVRLQRGKGAFEGQCIK